MSKKLDAPYRSGPSKSWLKVKNSKALARVVLSKVRSEHRSIGIAAQEFLVRVLGVDAPTGD